jgi:hypothetical protein
MICGCLLLVFLLITKIIIDIRGEISEYMISYILIIFHIVWQLLKLIGLF